MIAPCKHLDYDRARAPGLMQGEQDGIRFWIRGRDENNYLQRCQFCMIKRFRINKYVDCYEDRDIAINMSQRLNHDPASGTAGDVICI